MVIHKPKTEKYYVKDPSGALIYQFHEKSIAISVAQEKNNLYHTKQFKVVKLAEIVIWEWVE